MDRDEFCSILQKEYDILFEKWYQYTQQLGPLHEELRSLKDLVNKVNGSDHLIVHFVVSIKETIFNRLVASFKSASKRIATLECAIEKLESRNTIYCHLDHFSVEEYPLYFSNCLFVQMAAFSLLPVYSPFCKEELLLPCFCRLVTHNGKLSLLRRILGSTDLLRGLSAW